MSFRLVFLACLIVFARGSFAAGAVTTPVLVELFTSEGCSSCPPADEVLAALDRDQPVPGAQIIVLAFHVDYWNDLGWKDRYSSADYSARQRLYAQLLDQGHLYTPQMVIDGSKQFEGSLSERAKEFVAATLTVPKALVALAPAAAKSGSLAFNVLVQKVPPTAAGDSAQVLLAIAEDGLASDVIKGENAGKRLAHNAVVRSLSTLGAIGAGPFSATPSVKIASTWNRTRLRAVVFVQEKKGLRVLGAASLKIQ